MKLSECLGDYLQSCRKKKERISFKKLIAVIVLVTFMVSTTNIFYIPQAFAANPQVSSAKTTQIFFEDGFDGTEIDSSKWNTDIATTGERCLTTGEWIDISSGLDGGLIQTPPYGSITVNGGQASFSAGWGRAFPYIWSGPPSRTFPFPDTGDFVLEIRMKYDSLEPHGDGLQAIYSDPASNNPPASGGIFDIWGDSQGLRVNSMNRRVSLSDPFDLHDYKLEYIDGKYSLYVDGVLKVEPIASNLRPNTITIGNPVFASWVAAEWTDFTVDYVRVTALNQTPVINITEPQDLTSVKGKVPITVQGTNTDNLMLTITDYIKGTVVFQQTVAKTENTWLWDSTDILDGIYLIKVQGGNSTGKTAEDQVLIEVKNTVPGMGFSPIQASSSFTLNAQQFGMVNYNGNLLLLNRDLALSDKPVPLVISRYFNSQQNAKSELGSGWRLGIPYLSPKVDGTVLYFNETGKKYQFDPETGGNYQTPAGTRLRLSKQPDGTYKLEHPAAHLTWQFATNGLLQTVTDNNGNKLQYTYKGNKITKITDGFNRETTFTYDQNGRIIQITEYTGRTVKYSYTGELLTQVTRPDGTIDKYSYDPAGRIKSAYDTSNNLSQVSYNPDGGVGSLTDTAGQTVYYSYAPYQLIRTNLAGKSQVVTYDQYGQVTSYTNENGNKTIYEYDGRGNPIAVTDPDLKVTSYKYDTRDNLIEKKDPNGNITVYSYDSSNNLTQIKDSVGNVIAYSYDSKNNRIQESYTTVLPDGKSTGYSLDYTYDNRGNLTKVKMPKGRLRTSMTIMVMS